jgi:phage terminase large subunit-like protein
MQSEDRWEGEPLKLEPWQKRFWKEALKNWRSVVLIVPRKNGKTQMLAAYALYELMYASGRPEILLAAASDRQAGRLFAAASRFVRRHEGLSQALRVRDQVSVSSDGRQANGGSSEADGETTISADGRFVAFSSSASNLVAGDTNKATDVFLRDRETGTTTLVSVGR